MLHNQAFGPLGHIAEWLSILYTYITDRNTKFFQQAILKRARKNRIVFILDEHGNSVASPDDIANVLLTYFNQLFTTQIHDNNTTTNQEHEATISDDFTLSVPNDKELYELLRQMKRDASPAPDGLNVAFYIAAWPWIKNEVTELIRNFYNAGQFPPQLNSTCIVLIPKTHEPNNPKDFRPISLCIVIYKLISKSLVLRSKDHLPDYVHASQAASIQGRHITTNIILVQEIVHSFRLSS
ncbi:hypothetical protein PR202_gb05734 [Eleusine coracana subsp. coracana]|uniref:Uncharacterized protein n=1 Tax=Eleusine coracana subsp. coracana TaxID=191504 RepID=A0AAV5E7I4_ELECO|nr:hypothetical protein PR202_gb05734 [Eleusine coracana subsp. coracana]